MPITLSRITVTACRVPIDAPVATSFGVMLNRPAVFVRLEDSDGTFGWGEIFANWPAAGAEHRARLLVEDMADLLLGHRFDGAKDLFTQLRDKTHIRALQCGEWGPFRQVIAGLDTAMTDLEARRAGLPVARFLNPDALQTLACYASGIAIAQAMDQIAQSRALGFSTFKVKVGFDQDRDTTLLRALVQSLGTGETLCADANQAWDLPEAERFVAACRDLPLGWLEEPLPADAPLTHWQALTAQCPIPLAGAKTSPGQAALPMPSPRAFSACCNPTSPNGAASAAAGPWRRRSAAPGCATARTSLAAVSALSPRHIFWRRPRATDFWKST
jgi:L-alanine-DL-glutamate epimerase-like enolase superfamily enzyme